jgi:hypothetical protein
MPAEAARREIPDAMFFSERSAAANRAEGDLFAGRFHLQGVARLQMQLLAQRLGNYNPPSLINS